MNLKLNKVGQTTLKPGRRDGLLIPEREYVLYLDEVKRLIQQGRKRNG